ncbi:Sir2 family NAD-dependent protein deacetylase [Saccharospirillum sp. HFRX-1]|uniref:Sir2 family NAD-dependent protein deacetylase n=1 Tax=unclassified Saccharospirillum TaxID=2633430 RepID=UPI0037247FB4
MQPIVVFSGSGLSAGAGLATFRGADGLWRQHDPLTLATPQAWQTNTQLVTEFYNERRALAWKAQPTAAHRAIARLESRYPVQIITQNVDDLHERAGSSAVIHLHGVLDRVRSTADASNKRWMHGEAVDLNERAADGGQWRPDVVWFGESVLGFSEAEVAMAAADKVLVVGTSLTVQPAASLLTLAADKATKVIINAEPVPVHSGFELILGNADECLPDLVEQWLSAEQR